MGFQLTEKIHQCAVLILVSVVFFLPVSSAQADPYSRMWVQVVDASGPNLPDSSTAIPEFSAREVLDLKFVVVIRPPIQTGNDIETLLPEVLEFSVLTPDGNLYRKIVLPVTSQEPAKGGRVLPGYARPVEERQFEVHRDKIGLWVFTTTVRFPVAATDIVSRGIYGQWMVSVEGTGEGLSLYADSDFELVP